MNSNRRGVRATEHIGSVHTKARYVACGRRTTQVEPPFSSRYDIEGGRSGIRRGWLTAKARPCATLPRTSDKAPGYDRDHLCLVQRAHIGTPPHSDIQSGGAAADRKTGSAVNCTTGTVRRWLSG